MYISFDHISTNSVPLGEVIKSIDQNLTDFFIKNIKVYHKDEEQKMFGLEINGLFPFTKTLKGGYYRYHLFPKLDLKLVENERLMKTFSRDNHITRLLNLMDEQFETKPPSYKVKDPNKKEEANSLDESKDPHEMKQIFMTWIIMWCATFSYQDQIEQYFRVNQLL